jgi:Kelch motif
MAKTDPSESRLRSFYSQVGLPNQKQPPVWGNVRSARLDTDWKAQVVGALAIVMIAIGVAVVFQFGRAGRSSMAPTAASAPSPSVVPSVSATPPSLSSPGPRSGAAMAYDERGKHVLLFGGASLVSPYGGLNDTWIWDGQQWGLEHSLNAPSARTGAAMTYDASSGDVILFGGLSTPTASKVLPGQAAPTGPLDDTWTWDGKAWLKHKSAAPSPRYGSFMVFDAARDQVLLFGGTAPGNSVPYSDTWTWDGRTWIPHQSAKGPSGWATRGVVYDENTRRVLLLASVPACSIGNCQLWQVWSWNGASWSLQQTSQLPAETGNGVVIGYDAHTREAVLFGGQSGGGMTGPTYFSETWTWNERWVLRHPTASPPPQDYSASALAYDPYASELILFDPSGNTWAWDGTTWKEVSQASH